MRIRLPLLIVAAMACVAMGAKLKPMSHGDRFPGTWTITITPSDSDARQPGVKPFDEELTFNPNEMSTKVLQQHGFKTAPYDADTSGAIGPATFKCKQTSDAEGTIEWQGLTTTGDDLSGTLVWTKKDGSIIHYDFKGEKKAS
jgi:hypothetical protein